MPVKPRTFGNALMLAGNPSNNAIQVSNQQKRLVELLPNAALSVCTYLIRNIVHHYDTVCASVVTTGYSSEPLLTSCVPLQWQPMHI